MSSALKEKENHDPVSNNGQNTEVLIHDKLPEGYHEILSYL